MRWLADVDAVFFDAVGTLIHPEPAAAQAYAEIGRRHGSQLAPAVIRALRGGVRPGGGSGRGGRAAHRRGA